MIELRKMKGDNNMNTTMIICAVVGIVLLLLIIASKTMDIVLGLLSMIGGIASFIWLGTPDSWITQLRIALEFGVTPDQLKTGCLVLAGIGLVIFIIGLARGKTKERIVYVEKQVPYQPTNTFSNPTPVTPVTPVETVEEVKPVEPVNVEPVKAVEYEPENKANKIEVAVEEEPNEAVEEVNKVEEKEPAPEMNEEVIEDAEQKTTENIEE